MEALQYKMPSDTATVLTLADSLNSTLKALSDESQQEVFLTAVSLSMLAVAARGLMRNSFCKLVLYDVPNWEYDARDGKFHKKETVKKFDFGSDEETPMSMNNLYHIVQKDN